MIEDGPTSYDTFTVGGLRTRSRVGTKTLGNCRGSLWSRLRNSAPSIKIRYAYRVDRYGGDHHAGCARAGRSAGVVSTGARSLAGGLKRDDAGRPRGGLSVCRAAGDGLPSRNVTGICRGTDRADPCWIILSQTSQLVFRVGKVGDLFSGRGVTRSVPCFKTHAVDEVIGMFSKAPQGLIYANLPS